MRSQPLFIVGSPRSGTTFFTQALNQHPSVNITNETRIFVLLKDLIDIRARHPWLLERAFQEPFAAFARRHAGAWIEQFYREELGVSEPIWGDKHPHYADPLVLKGEAALVSGAEPGSCLRLIRDSLPEAKFIHIHRDPRDVAYSLNEKKWVRSLEEGVAVWRRHVEEIERFFHEIGQEKSHLIAYADLRSSPEQVANGLARFLDLDAPTSILEFLKRQRLDPTPFSGPVTNLRLPSVVRRLDDPGNKLFGLAGTAAEVLGYRSDEIL